MREFYNMDCMEGMKQYPDQYFDLAIVDPPYGGVIKGGGGTWFSKYNQTSEQRGKYYNRFGGLFEKYKKEGRIAWDIAPDESYFEELFRVSKNQIIWGGNYFPLPPTRCFIVWRKHIAEDFSMAMAEYAWTSFDANAKVFEKASFDKERFHPTQKPVSLYTWLLNNYAKEGDIILDTHVGSGSSLVACERLGFQYVGYEIDETYYEQAKKRIEAEHDQLSMFRNEEEDEDGGEQLTL